MNFGKMAFVLLVATTASTSSAQLLHRYRCNETCGVVTDAVGDANGTVGSDALLHDGFCQLNLSDNQFNQNSYIRWDASVGAFGTSDFAISVTLRTTSTRFSDVIGTRADPSAGNFVSVRMGSDGFVGFEICQDVNGTNYAGIGSLYAINDGQWHTVVCIRVANVISMTIDGVDQGSATADGVAIINNSFPLQAGFSPISPVFGLALTADIDEVAIYGALPPPPTCLSDFNHDGISNSTDVSDFINQWFADQTDGCHP